MTWKRALLIIAAALLLWLRPWRRLLGRPAPAAGGTQPARPDDHAPEVLPVPPLRDEQPAPAGAGRQAEELVAPEDAFGAAPSDEMLAGPRPEDPPAVAFRTGDDLAPEAAFAAPGPELLVGDELDAALDLVEEPELAAEPGPVAVAAEDAAGPEGREGERAVGDQAAAPDDLLVIEGIGPRVSTIVTAAGITSFEALAAADVDRLRAVLVDAGIKTVDPSTWPEQARIADEGRWDDLRELQVRIKNGKKT